MAVNTLTAYRNQLMYCVFIRNYSEEGTFEALRKDLFRIRELGVDVIWLMPIHPLGEKARKGSLGSPYAIRDYRAVNPEFGTMEDFVRLVDDIHSQGMKCIIDVVYNHTSPDSWLARNHPEWFYHRPDGSFGNRVGDWTDIVDLDYTHQDLWEYQIDTLKMWAQYVDGFRCDVAPMVPLAFWLKARQAVETVRPGCLWLAESVEPGFIAYMRANGVPVHSDGELYQAFDLCYDYDIWDAYQGLFSGVSSLKTYADALNQQEQIYPENYVKLRCLENHDRPRAAALISENAALRNWTAFSFFQKGMAFLYAGQEYAVSHTPGLFDRDTVQWNTGKDLSDLIRSLAQIKKAPVFSHGAYSAWVAGEGVLMAEHSGAKETMLGIFSVMNCPAFVETGLADGIYEELLSGKTVQVNWGRIEMTGEPLILKV